MNKHKLLKHSVGILFFCFFETMAQDCAGTEKYGKNNPDSNTMPTNPNSYYLVCQDPYVFTCCGVINRWQYDADIDSQPVELQVWRKVDGTANTYKMISTFSHTAGSKGDQDFSPTASNFVNDGDCIGWYSSGTDVIGYKTGGNSASAMVLPAGSVTTPDSGVDWSGATVTSNFEWAIGAEVGAPSDPVFASASTVTISDALAVSGLVLDVSFTDSDVGDTIVLSMTSNDYFDFTDSGNGAGTINVKSSLYGQSGAVTVTVTATDDCAHTTTQNIVITITNSPPEITNLVASETTSEDVPAERLITTYTCTDTSGSATATISEDPANTPPFFITKLTGGAANEYGIYVRSQSNAANGVFNYNDQMSYTLTVTCDDTIDTVTQDILVYLSQNTPPVINNLPSNVNISINTVNGTVIFDVDITDADGDTVFASITTSPSPAPFTILDSGHIQVSGSLQDFIHTGYDIYVSVRDSKNSGIDRTLSVIINDTKSPPQFTNMNNTVTIDEDTASGVSIFTVSATDADGDALTMLWSEPTGGTSYFDLDPTTGIVTTSTLIDYETIAAGSTLPFQFEVVVSDGQASVTSTLTVSIIDLNEQLNFTSSVYRVSVVEWTAVGVTLTNPGFSIIDSDTSDTYTYTMDCGTTYDGYFQMSTDNTITVTSLYKLDDGLPTTVTCTVQAVDSGGNSDTASLIITILYDNNFTPTFSNTNYDFSVDPSALANTDIGIVTATDDDVDSYGNFSYALNQTALNASYFKIDGTTGQISTLRSMSSCGCSGTTFTFPVLATDTGGLVGTSTVQITVTETTTISNPDRFKQFWDDTRNLVWFSILMVLVAVTLIVTLYVCLRYICMNPTGCRMPCQNGNGRFFRGPRYNRGYSPPRQVEQYRPKQSELVSVRRPPGDKHQWQKDMARY